jgi:hypothetical protein
MRQSQDQSSAANDSNSPGISGEIDLSHACRSSEIQGSVAPINGQIGGMLKAMPEPRAFVVMSLDKLLQTTLDPFVRLPIDASGYERHLLHHWLVHGCKTAGLSPTTPNGFDPTTYAASHFLQADGMYVLTHIAMGEWAQCRRRQAEPSRLVYRRRGDAYKHMQKLLEIDSPLHQIAGLIQLFTMDTVLSGPATSAAHLIALHRLIEDAGAFRDAKVLSIGAGPKLDLGFIAPFFVLADLPVEDEGTFSDIVVRFSKSLQLVSTVPSITTTTNGKDAVLVQRLRMYVRWLIDTYLEAESTTSQQKAGVFAFTFLLAVVQSVYQPSADALLDMFAHLSHTLFATINAINTDSDSPSAFENNPCSRLWLFWHVRSSILQGSDEAEAQMTRNLLDVLKLAPYLPSWTTIRLAKYFSERTLEAAGSSQWNSMLFQYEIEQICAGLRRARAASRRSEIDLQAEVSLQAEMICAQRDGVTRAMYLDREKR